jgi:tricorn protease-like protein
VTISSASGLLAIENMPGQVSIYSLSDMEKRDELTFAREVSAMRFSADGTRLLVLTEDQQVFWIDTSETAKREAMTN